MDVKDATENPPPKSSLFVEDEQIYALVYMDYFTEKGYTSKEDLSEDEMYFFEDLEVNNIYFRYTGQTPKTIKQAFKIAEKDFFFSPVYIWLKGEWYDMFGKFDYDKYLEGDDYDNSF